MEAGEIAMKGAGGRVLPTLVLGVFLIFGVGGVFLFGLGFRQRLETRFWESTPAEMRASGLKELETAGGGDRSFSVNVRYAYEWAGKRHESTSFSQPNQTYAHRDEVLKLLVPFPEGAAVTCRLDPAHPGRSVLQPDTLWMGWLAVFPGLIAAFAACGLVTTWTRDPAESLGRGPSGFAQKAAVGMRVCFGGLFIAIGVGVLFGMLVPHWQKGGATWKWIETRCTILTAGLDESRASDSQKTVRAGVEYRYEFAGREFVGDRIQANNGFTNNDQERATAERWQPGTAAVCYVNSDQPCEAVLVRGAGALWAPALMALVFLFGGGWVTFRSLR